MKAYKYIIISWVLVFMTSMFIASCKLEAEKSEEEQSDKGGSVGTQNLPKAPMFQGINLVDGKDVSLKDMEGYVLIIDFWASWCPACRKEIPVFIELYNKYKDNKFAIVGISVDRTKADAVKFISAQGINYPVIMGTKQIISEYEKAMGQPVRYIPTTLVVDRSGGIVSIYIGFKAKDVFDREIQKLI